MYKTVWNVWDNTDNVKTEITYYHFNKEPKFPANYILNNCTLEMVWNLKLVRSVEIFIKCLFHQIIIR